jgi:hypothetical protein
MTITSALSRLFSDPWERSITERTRQEPRLASIDSGQDMAALEQPAQVAALPPPADNQNGRYDMRNISPRDFADATHELYMDGTLNWNEFKMVGFPSELDPRYDETIGALIGEKANPDQPKDMLGQWEQRVDFEKRYNPYPDQVKTAESVLNKLTVLSQPPLSLSA